MKSRQRIAFFQKAEPSRPAPRIHEVALLGAPTLMEIRGSGFGKVGGLIRVAVLEEQGKVPKVSVVAWSPEVVLLRVSSGGFGGLLVLETADGCVSNPMSLVNSQMGNEVAGES